jgi:hypothetical protein
MKKAIFPSLNNPYPGGEAKQKFALGRQMSENGFVFSDGQIQGFMGGRGIKLPMELKRPPVRKERASLLATIKSFIVFLATGKVRFPP